jgi:hypothetical protein
MPPIIAAILTAGVGLLFCFFGYRLFLVMLPVLQPNCALIGITFSPKTNTFKAGANHIHK